MNYIVLYKYIEVTRNKYQIRLPSIVSRLTLRTLWRSVEIVFTMPVLLIVMNIEGNLMARDYGTTRIFLMLLGYRTITTTVVRGHLIVVLVIVASVKYCGSDSSAVFFFAFVEIVPEVFEIFRWLLFRVGCETCATIVITYKRITLWNGCSFLIIAVIFCYDTVISNRMSYRRWSTVDAAVVALTIVFMLLIRACASARVRTVDVPTGDSWTWSVVHDVVCLLEPARGYQIMIRKKRGWIIS